ncbi:MAG: hypothetical protein ACREH9_04805 [Pseudomonadota bacterium]
MYVLNQPFAPTRLSYLGKIPLMNQAVERGVYYPPKYATHRVLHGMGQTSTVSTPLLLGGIGVAALAFLLWRKKSRGGSGSTRRAARLGAQRALAARQLRELES